MNENKVFIIAEAGVNHNGSLEIAKKLIDVASEAGADAVKFQTFKAENLAGKNAKKARYQLNTTEEAESQFDMLKKLEVSYSMHIELMRYCEQKKIMFLSTPFDIESLNLLLDLGISIIKIPSGEINNLPYLREISKCYQPIILSTGMSNLQEIKDALKVLAYGGNKNISILHCNTQYPTPYKDVNLKALQMLREELQVPIGYSDHTEGIEVPIAAVAAGAVIIEKHFTLSRDMEGPDHKASLEPEELNKMVKAIRNIELAMGKRDKQPSDSEIENLRIVRKSIVAKRCIKKGERFSKDNITTKRPGTGINPMNWDDVIGLSATRDFEMDELIEL